MAFRIGFPWAVALLLCLAKGSQDFVLAQFRAEVDAALQRLHGILDEARRPRFPADVPHHYEDKFLLVELSTQAAASSLVELFALTTNSTVPQGDLTFRLCFACNFLKTEEKDVQVGTAQVEESESILGTWRSTVKNTAKVTEHLWNHTTEWHLNGSQGTLLHGFTGDLLKTLGDRSGTAPEPPIPSSCVRRELNLRWLRQGLHFAVNRSAAECRTPSVNLQTQAALEFFARMEAFAHNSEKLLLRKLTAGEAQVLPDLQGHLFRPVFALFAMENASKPVLTADLPTVLGLYRRTLAEKLEENDRMFSAKLPSSLIRLSLLLAEMKSLAKQLLASVQALEGLLHQQLTSALGKTLRSSDFGEYMDFHGRMILGDAYAPKPFVYTVRRPEHHPEGTISVEAASSPIRSFSLHLAQAPAMRVQLSSAATVTLQGEHFVHAAIFHRFANEPEQELRLVARARQLSSFVLMVGKIAAADRFEPTAALIIQNKDDLVIPLLLETVPTPKEFIDSIQSLSPEQQRFARAFRKMQLSSSLFAIAVVQIKPLLEKVLKLPEFSLTKEIHLTQDLIELFVKYQVPPDLMSYEDASVDKLGRASAAQKIQQVKSHVDALWQTIAASKSKQLKETQDEAKMRNMQRCGAEECPVRESMQEEFRPHKGAKRAMKEMLDFESVTYSAPPPQQYRLLKMSAAPQEQFIRVEEKGSAEEEEDSDSVPDEASKTFSPHAGRSEAEVPSGSWDYTRIPHELDANYLKFDTDAKLRPSNIKVSSGPWQKQEQPGFLGDLKTRNLDPPAQRLETNQAFDLLDALSRSGNLVLEGTSLHVVLAATHCFDETIIDTAIKQNQNPIEKLERSMLIVASTIHRTPASLLLQPGEVQRMRELSPALFADPVSKGIFPR